MEKVTHTFTCRDSNDESKEIIQYPTLVGLLEPSYLGTQLWIRLEKSTHMLTKHLHEYSVKCCPENCLCKELC